MQALLDQLLTAQRRAVPGSAREAVLSRFGQLVVGFHEAAAAPSTPERTRCKMVAFLGFVEASADRLGDRMTHPTYILNAVGEAMVRSDLIHEDVVGLIQVGLYFFGLEQIERRWSSRALVYSGIHADHLEQFLTRASLKQTLQDGRNRLESGRRFCLTYTYINALRKAYWKQCRASEDVLDVACTGSLLDEDRSAPVPPAALDGSDRMALMLRVFQRVLSPEQQWIYLAKNRASLSPVDVQDSRNWIDAILGEDAGTGGDLGWAEISRRLGINEKTAKREYLRALHGLLDETARAVFGDEPVPSRYVRRILEQIREAVSQKDLRLKETTGRGLGVLVEKWEVALRFVLNHERVVA